MPVSQPTEMSNRIMAPFRAHPFHHRQRMSSTPKAPRCTAWAIIKIFFQPTVGTSAPATAQVSAIAQPAIRQMPAGTTPPLVITYNASTVPVLQLASSSRVLSEQQVLDLTQNFLRPQLTTVRGAAVTFPSGGRQRQIMVDLEPPGDADLRLSATDVQERADGTEPDHPVGATKIGSFQYTIQLQTTPPRPSPISTICR